MLRSEHTGAPRIAPLAQNARRPAYETTITATEKRQQAHETALRITPIPLHSPKTALKAPRDPSQGQNEVAPLVRCRPLLEPRKGESRRIGEDAEPERVSPLQGFVVGCARDPGALPLARVAARLQRAGVACGESWVGDEVDR